MSDRALFPAAIVGAAHADVARAVPLARLYALRASYLLLVVGLGSAVWPAILRHAQPWTLTGGVVKCMLGALSTLAVIGLFKPLSMLPLLLFEIGWKGLWLAVVAWPAWSSGQMDADTRATAYECLLGVLFVLATPWPYVMRAYLTGQNERWR